MDNKKRKFTDVVLNTTKSLGTPGKKRKMDKKDKYNEFISPFVISNKENKVKSEALVIKSGLKSNIKENKKEEEKEANNNNSHLPLQETNDNLINIENNININNAPPLTANNNSVFGNNIRCFKEINENNINTNLRKETNSLNTSITSVALNNKANKYKPTFPSTSVKINNTSNNIKVFQSSLKLRQVSQFTPITETKNEVAFTKAKNGGGRTPNKKSKLKSKSKRKSKSKSKFKSVSKPNISNISLNLPSKSRNNVNHMSNKNENNIKPLKGNSLNLETGTHITNTIVEENEVSKLKSKTLSKSISAYPRSLGGYHTATKTGARKLLDINSPNSQEVKKGQKSALESIDKAINSDNFPVVNKFNIASSNNISKIVHNTPTNDTNKQDATNNKTTFSSVGLNEVIKGKVKSIIKELISKYSLNNIETNSHKNYVYTGEEYSDIEESEFVILKQTSSFNFFKDIKSLYVTLLNKKLIESTFNKERRFIRYNYLIDCEKKKKFITTDNYIIKMPLDFEAIDKLRLEDKLPFKGYKIFLHPNCYTEKVDSSINESPADEIKHEVLMKLGIILGASIVNHIRLSDLCIINKVDSTQYFPPHVRNLNQDVIYDTLSILKLPDLENFKYKPKDAKYKRNRK